MYRTAIIPAHASARTFAVRGFATTSIRSKTLTETVKDTAQAASDKIGEAAAAAQKQVNKAASAAQDKAGEAARVLSDAAAGTSAEAPTKKDINESVEKAKRSANQALGDGAGAARDAKDKVNRKL